MEHLCVIPKPCLETRTSNLADTKVAWMVSTDAASGSLGVEMTEANPATTLWFPGLSMLADCSTDEIIEAIAFRT